MAESLEEYFGVAIALPGPLDHVEGAIEKFRGAGRFSLTELQAALPGGVFRDHLRAVLQALVSGGIIAAESEEAYILIPRASNEIAIRNAVRRCAAWMSARDREDRPRLLASAPAVAHQQSAGMPFERQFADLRTSVRALIAASKSELILASPFWDSEVATDLAPLIERRLAAGVRVSLLARRPNADSASHDALRILSRIHVAGQSCALRVLEERSPLDPFGTATFHFKAAASDNQRVYLGSANFNTAGLASRWELGVLLAGVDAGRICSLLSALFESSRPLVLQ